jgi:cytochrome d ubiquinol oxidase subunit I
VLGGFLAGGYFLLYLIGWALKKRPFDSRVLLYLQIPASIGSYLVYQFGWITDEVGRQPWIIYNVMTVAQAANQSTSLIIPGIMIIAFYLILVPTTFYFFIRVFNSAKPEEESKQPVPSSEISEVPQVNY